MARYEHLPIFKVAYDLAVWMEDTVRVFSRYNKYTIGQDLRNGARGLLKQIVRVNSSHDKRRHLEQLRAEIDELLVLVRLCKDMRAFASLAAYQHCANELTNLSRQSAGWLRSLGGQEPESAPPPVAERSR